VHGGGDVSGGRAGGIMPVQKQRHRQNDTDLAARRVVEASSKRHSPRWPSSLSRWSPCGLLRWTVIRFSSTPLLPVEPWAHLGAVGLYTGRNDPPHNRFGLVAAADSRGAVPPAPEYGPHEPAGAASVREFLPFPGAVSVASQASPRGPGSPGPSMPYRVHRSSRAGR
jgi:hypothetical protein